ncbi:MAG: hypothetical protein NTV01_18525, partial [Bacteroidia bacterium]|nr:hypothetical protein [Bacteroidia bacterium]
MLEAADSFPAELVNLLAFQLNQPDKQYSIEKITQEYQKLVPFPDEGLILGITNNRCLHVIRNKSIIKDTLFDSSEGILMDIGISSEQKPILIFLKDEIRERKLVAKTYPGGIILDTLIANGSPNIVRNSDDGAFLVENYNYLDNRYILWLPEKKQHRNINRNSNRLRYISFENKKLVFIYEAPDSSWLVQTVDGETLDTINYTLKAFGQNMVNSRMFFENRVNPNVLFFNNNTISIHSLTGQKISSKTPLTCIDVYQKDKLICLLDENRDLLFDYDFQNNTCKKRIKTSRESLQIAYIDSLLAITSLAQSYEIYSVQNGKRLYTLNNPSNSFFRFSKINKNEYLVSHYSGNKQYHELMTFPVLESDKAILNNPKKLNIVSAGKVNNLSISASNFENGEKIKEFQSSDSLQVTIIPSHTGLFFGVMTMNIKNKYLSVEVYDSDKVIWNKKVNFEISKETLGNRTFDNYSAQFDLGFSGFSRDDHYLAINIYDSLSARCYVFNTVDRSIDSLTAPARIITDPNSGINYSASQLTGNSMKIEQFEQGDKLSFTQVDFPGYYRDFDISGDRIWVLSQDSLYIFNEQGKRLFSAYSNGIINLEIADKSQLAFGTNYNDILTVFNSSGQILITKNLSNRYYELDLFTDYLVQNNTLYLLKSGVAADSLKLPPASLKNEMAINLYSTILHSNHTFPKLPGKIIKELSWIELSNHSDRIELTDKEFGNLLANQQYSKNPTFILNISASHPRIDNSAAIDWFIQNQGVNRFKAAADNLILRGTSNNKLNSILKKYQFDDSTRLNFMLSIYHSRFQNNENNRKSNQGNIADLEKRDRQLLKYMEQIFKEARQSNIQFNEFGTLCWSYLLAGDKVNGLPYAEAEYKKDSANSPVATNLIHYLWYNGKTEEARKLLQSRKDKLQIINVGLLP